MFQRNKKKQDDLKSFHLEIDYSKRNVHNISEWWSLLGLLFIFSFGYLSLQFFMALPEPLLNQDSTQHPESFISERAWLDMKLLTDIGPRSTGSYNNEVLAVEFLKREISYIQQLANKKQNVKMDLQVVSGAYYAGFKPHGMTNVYRNVQNVIVKLKGLQNESSVLLNCHFDSVASSPGASDDAASCTVMLEILRVLSRQDHVYRNSIIFLFNGAEETPLQASHGFITQHPWAKEIGAFLNLESVGSGGKEILFQTWKGSWLIDLYGKHIPYPNAQVAAEEIFQSGTIPSDTDFRIFRDFGQIPGMDFAHFINGYRYHTKYDHIDYLTYSVLQRTGDNILAMTKALANSEKVNATFVHSDSSTIYYDFLGLFFIHYSKSYGVIINLIISILSIVVPCMSLGKATRGIHNKHIRIEALTGFFATLMSTIVSIVMVYLIAVGIDVSGKSMAWYTYPSLAIGFYSIPTLLINCAFHTNGKRDAPLSLALKVQARLIGSNLLWATFTILTTVIGYRIGYVTMVILLLSLLTNCLIAWLKWHNTVNKWLLVHLIGQISTVLWASHFYHLVMSVFIPITGRSGGSSNPDYTIGFISCAFTVLITGYLTPLILLLRSRKKFFLLLILIFVTSRFILANTGLEFPYRDEINKNPTPQRLFITHTLRTFYDKAGNVRFTDSGFWMRDLDRNTKKTYESLSAPGTPISQSEDSFCNKEVFCGLPAYSCKQLHTGGFWLSGGGPIVRETSSLQLYSAKAINEYEKQFSFILTGHVLTSLLIRPKSGVQLSEWNIIPVIPEKNEFNGQKGYFVMITHGLQGDPMNITLNFKTNKPHYDGTVVDISLITTHWDYFKEHTPIFVNLLAKVPKWAFVVPSVASVESFTY